MAALFFLVLAALVLVAWAVIAYVRGSAEVLEPDAESHPGASLPI
jgi:hypothetical protein